MWILDVRKRHQFLNCFIASTVFIHCLWFRQSFQDIDKLPAFESSA
jgi:hypothetical protein